MCETAGIRHHDAPADLRESRRPLTKGHAGGLA